MMKKTLLIFISLVLIIAVLTSCDGINAYSTNFNNITSGVSDQEIEQILRYWAVFPEEGEINIVKAARFTVARRDSGVMITAYNRDGTVNDSSSIKYLDLTTCSYEITDLEGNVTKKEECTSMHNGIPFMIINVDKDDYESLQYSNDKELKENWSGGTYSFFENGSEQLNGNLKIKRRGFSSFEMPKMPFTLKLESKQPLAGMQRSKDWVLVSNYADKTLLRNYFAYSLGRKIGTAYTPDCRSVELYLSDGKVTEYMGVYLLVEKYTVDETRINISEMESFDTVGAINANSSLDEILAGSFLVETETADRFGAGDAGVKAGGIYLNIKSPDKSFFAPGDLWDTTSWGKYNVTKNKSYASYIGNFFSIVENSIISGVNSHNLYEFEKYVDIDSFIDYYIINELAKNVDGHLVLSTYFYKDKSGKLKISIWDFDIAFGNCYYGEDNLGNNCDETTGFFISENSSWYKNLMKIPEFRSRLTEKWMSLRKSVLSDAEISSVINEEAGKISKAADANFKRWEIMGQKEWPNPDYIAYECITFEDNVSHMIDWIQQRAGWLDKELPTG